MQMEYTKIASRRRGARDFMAQRTTALALVPLTLWFIVSMLTMAGRPYREMVAFVATPWHATLLALLVVAGFYHAVLGLETVLEDYVPEGWQRRLAIWGMKAGAVVLGVLALASIVKVLFWGALA
jgi:succinate dehydrogenase / fumarate reductase membrane anchor subunit